MTSVPDVDGVPGAEPTPDPRQPVRASDADRHGTVLMLQDAVARGLLTHDEGGERMTAAFAARYAHELAPLTADLPPAPPSRPQAPGWRTLGLLTVEQIRATATGDFARRYRWQLAVAAALALVLLAVLGAAAGYLLFGGSHYVGAGGFGGPRGGGFAHYRG